MVSTVFLSWSVIFRLPLRTVSLSRRGRSVWRPCSWSLSYRHEATDQTRSLTTIYSISVCVLWHDTWLLTRGATALKYIFLINKKLIYCITGDQTNLIFEVDWWCFLSSAHQRSVGGFLALSAVVVQPCRASFSTQTFFFQNIYNKLILKCKIKISI